MAYTFNDADADDRHTVQYFELGGNRGIYHQGWTAVTKHRTPWIVVGALPGFDDDPWELYGPDDWTQAHNLAGEQPEKLTELQRLFVIEATKYNVLPLDDRGAERFNPDLAGRPTLIRGTRQLLYPGMGNLNENWVLNIKNKSHSVTAEVVVPDGGASGVILNQGGLSGGWSFYVKDGKPKYCYNLVGLRQFTIEADRVVPEGTHQLRMEFAYDGGGLAKGGTVTLYLDGAKVGEGRVDATIPLIFTADETTDVGRDTGAPVTPDYGTDNAFTGQINWVQLDIGTDSHDHIIDPAQLLHFAVARQ